MKVYVNYNNKKWKQFKIDFEKIANSVFKNQRAEVSITLIDDKEIHKLNRKYRNIDKPTNVLSFELDDDILLGDIYISLDTVTREAKDANISVAEHTAHMVVHGVLHLLGYDHLNNYEAKIMESKEIAILKKLGYKNPYKEDRVCDVCMSCPGNKFFSWVKKLHLGVGGKMLLGAMLGMTAALGFAPYNLWWLTLLSVGAAYYLATSEENISFGRAWVRAIPFGAFYAITMFWWMLHSIYVLPSLAAEYAIWTIPGVIGIGLFGALFFALPFAVVGSMRVNYYAKPILFAINWTLVLWLREWVFTGFPWNPIANVMLNFPIVANSMALWGALGLTFIIVGLCTAWVNVLRNRKCGNCWLVLLMFVGLFGVGCFVGRINMEYSFVGADAPMPIIRIVQPAFSQNDKMFMSRGDAILNAKNQVQKLIDIARGDDVDIVVYPETTYPFGVCDTDVLSLPQSLNTPVVIGANVFKDNKVYNSMLVTDKFGNITNVYHKSHLVPFGEYSPLGLLPSPSSLSSGDGPTLINIAYGDEQEFLFAPAVCYEIIFSDSLIQEHDLDAIINITNDNWFGDTPGTYQHLDMVRRYAIESGVPVVRANYSGISAFVGSDGNIISSLPVGFSGVLDGFVWGAHLTPYRIIGLNGWMIILLVVSGLLVIRKKH